MNAEEVERGPQAYAWSPRPREPSPGDALGRYVILETLGRGGMGTVYAARDPGLDRKVALKLLHATVEQQRLLREAKAMARLAHPNVVAVYDVGTVDKRVFVAMELVDGWTVRDWLAAAPRTWRDIVGVFVDAARGLAAAHDAGLIHRDFKPDNVLVGKDGRARVLDFGLVSEQAPPPLSPAPIDGEASTIDLEGQLPSEPPRFIPDHPLDDPHIRLTLSGMVMGTPAYMAPEQYRSEPADTRSDQFAFAIALWESLFGERPFRASTFAALMVAVTNGELHEPRDPRAAPRWLHRILRRALSTDPAARYPSMAALLTDLRLGAESAEARVPLAGGRYEPIDGPGDGTIPRRLLDRLTNQVVTLQPIVTDLDGDPAETRLALSRDFMHLMALDHPHVVQVLDFGIDDERRPYVVLDASAHAESLLDVARRSSMAVKKSLLTQLLGALGYLHRRELVHGDLSPAHVRVAQGQLKLVMLGAASLPRARQRVLGAAIPSGSSDPILEPAREEGLLAPELRRGEPATPASDLWTFGAIARRVLDDGTDLDPSLAQVLDKLTATDPAQRFTRASEAALALGRASGTALVLDTAETRDSFLQTARLVGREAELAQLTGALLSATHGHGSAWLVGGESGVGKSRLLEELRARAHVEGALVVHGHAESASDPYAPWREALRALLVVSEVTEFDASVLLPIVPDLPRLLGRPVSPAPELDGPSMHTRLRQVVQRILHRQARPVVLILEDLQWAASATIELLRAVEPSVASLALMVIGTYRNEERPKLPADLPGFRVLPLERLELGGVRALVASMLGPDNTTVELVDLLARESEGNAFFLVECVRALADEAGGVDRIVEQALPEKVLAGGIRRVLRRRLERMPAAAAPALRLAAVLGRRIDGELLGRGILRNPADGVLRNPADGVPAFDIETWIRTGIDAAVLERSGADVHFGHDKLREEILRELGDEERRALHATAARVIEEVYGPVPARATALALHHREAGNVAAEARYTAQSGELALSHGANAEAADRLERALALSPDLPALERARLNTQLGSAYFFQMDFARSEPALRAAARAAGVNIPSSGGGRLAFLLKQLATQIGHRLFGVRVAPPEERAALLEASRAAARLSNLFIFENESVGVLGTSLLAVNLSERAAATNHLSLSMLGFAAGAAGLTRASDAYFARIHQAQPEPDELRGLASGAIAESMAYLGRGRLDLAERRATDNLALCERIGDRLNKSYTEYGLGIIAYYRGSLDDALHLLSRAQRELDPADARHAVNFASWEILVASTLGRPAHAEAHLAATKAGFGPHDRLSEGIWHGVHALVLARRGRLEEAKNAVQEAHRCVPNVRSAPPTAGGLIAGIVETALLGLETRRDRESEREAERALAYGQKWAQTYPIGRPALLGYRARHAQLLGQPARAHTLLSESASVAHGQGNALGEVSAALAIARLDPGAPQPSGEVAVALRTPAEAEAARDRARHSSIT